MPSKKPPLATAPDLPERYRLALWEEGLVLADVHLPGGSALMLVEAEELFPVSEEGEAPSDPTIN
jgi:hypothetical protein